MSQSTNLKPVYLLAGPQALLIERYIDELKTTIENNFPGYQQFTYHTESDSIEEIIGNANNYSIFQETKLIVVKNCEKLKKDDISAIEKYIDSAPKDCFIVLFSNETNKPKIKKHNNLESQTFKSGDKIEQKVIQEARLIGLKLTPKAAHELQKLLGDDLKVINNELLKIAQYFGDKEIISDKDILGFITKRSHDDIFQLLNSIAGKDKKSAVKVLNELRSINYDPVSIVSTLSWRIRQIWHLKEISKSGMNDSEIIKKLKISSGALYYLKKQAGNFSYQKISSAMSGLAKLDREIKSYSQDKYNLISRFIIKICEN